MTSNSPLRAEPGDATRDVRFVHAGALVVREHGLLIRGASGSGKSALAHALVQEAQRRTWFARIVADDSVGLEVRGGRLVAHAHPRTAGQVERRGVGIGRVVHEPACIVHLVIDLADPAGLMRMPDPADILVSLDGVTLPRLAVPAGAPVSDNLYRVLESIDAFSPS